MQRPVGTLDQQAVVDAIWRTEGLVVLAWSLGWLKLPPYDELAVPADVGEALGTSDPARATTMLDEAALVSRTEIDALYEHLLAFHWRVRNYRLRPVAMDFVEFSQNCWFGSFDISKFRIIDGDLAIGDKSICDASQEQLSVLRKHCPRATSGDQLAARPFANLFRDGHGNLKNPRLPQRPL